MGKTYSKSFKWRVDIENLYICLHVTSLKRQILKFYYSIVRLRQHRRGLHTAKSLDILKISCFNCNVDKKKRKIKWKDILRTNLPTLPSKKIWLKITCNARINRPRDGIQRKTPKFFSCSLALQERVNNIAQAEISSATSDDCNCIERRLH